MCYRSNKLAFTVLLFLAAATAWATPTEEELFFKSVADVNEGALNFLATPPARPVHHHQNKIVITRDSLSSGWVGLEQCHHHLDAVASLQIVYRPERIRALSILQSKNIGRAWVHENTVQMEQIARDALICIRGETLALQDDGAGVFSLANGPYMRQFLDGFYPMRVSMRVRIEHPGLRFLDLTPPPQPGFNVEIGAAEIGYDAWFEGRLNTLMRFRLGGN